MVLALGLFATAVAAEEVGSRMAQQAIDAALEVDRKVDADYRYTVACVITLAPDRDRDGGDQRSGGQASMVG